MSGPSWIAGPLAGLMLLTAGYCLARITISVRRGRPADRLVDATHVLTGVTMAGMLSTSLALPRPGALPVVFGTGAAVFGWRAIRERQAHSLQHALGCAAMAYMLGSNDGGSVGAMAGPSTAALVLAFGLLGGVVWSADRLTVMPAAAHQPIAGTAIVPLSLRLAAGCDIAMGVTMGYLLIVTR